MLKKEKIEFTPLDINEKKLPAFETELKSNLIKPISPIHSAMKKILIKSPMLSNMDTLAAEIYKNLGRCIKDLSVFILNFDGVIKTIGNPTEADESFFDIVWEKVRFGTKKININGQTRFIFFSVFPDDIYIMVSTTDSIDTDDQFKLVAGLKNMPKLLGRML